MKNKIILPQSIFNTMLFWTFFYFVSDTTGYGKWVLFTFASIWTLLLIVDLLLTFCVKDKNGMGDRLHRQT